LIWKISSKSFFLLHAKLFHSHSRFCALAHIYTKSIFPFYLIRKEWRKKGYFLYVKNWMQTLIHSRWQCDDDICRKVPPKLCLVGKIFSITIRGNPLRTTAAGE
jgi:hypothetical protein